MTKHGPWQIIQSHEVYRDACMVVTKDDVVRPDGKPGTYSVMNLVAGVCVLAMDTHRNVYLTDEFHYGVGRNTIEAVSGGIEPNEDTLATAKRELKEELGIEARDWKHLGVVDPLTGSLVSPTQLYMAQDLTFGEQAPEGTELIKCVKTRIDDAVQMVLDSRITHGPSCVLILKAHLLCSDDK